MHFVGDRFKWLTSQWVLRSSETCVLLKVDEGLTGSTSVKMRSDEYTEYG